MAFIQGIRGPANTRDEEHDLTNSFKKGRTFLKKAGNVTSGALKLVSPFINILASAGVFSANAETKDHITKGVTLACTIVKTPNLAANAFKEAAEIPGTTEGAPLAERLVKVASGTTALALGVLSCFALSETIIAIFSAFSTSLGNGFKVVEAGISTMLPFIGVFSAIELVKSLLDVGVEGFKLYRTAKKISATTEKMEIWKDATWTDTSFVSKKLDHLKGKQIKALNDLEEMGGLEGAVNKTFGVFKEHVKEVEECWKELEARKLELTKRLELLDKQKHELTNRNVIVRLFHQIAPQIKLTAAILKKEEVEEAHIKALNTFNKINSKHSLRTIKIRNFKVIQGKILAGPLKEGEIFLLKTFQSKKAEKWEKKKINLKAKAIQHGVKIGLKIVVVISLIAALALTFSGAGTMPGIVTNASVALFVMAAEYGLKKFKEYNPPEKWGSVKVPLLLTDQKIENIRPSGSNII
jgi:hypothetical protein